MCDEYLFYTALNIYVSFVFSDQYYVCRVSTSSNEEGIILE